VTEASLPPPYERLPSLIAHGAPADVAKAVRATMLANVLRYAKAAAPFYADRIPQALFEAPPTPALWRTVRLLTKDDLRAHHLAIKIAKPPPFAGQTREAWTSGATGTPFNAHVSALADRMNAGVLQRLYRWWRADAAKDLLHLAVDRRGYQVSPAVETTQGWYPGDPRGKYHRVTISTGIDAQLDHLVALKPAYLKCAAVHLGALALRARERRLDLKFDLAFAGASPLMADERQLVAEIFGCRVVDIYGTEEIGILAADCPRCGKAHPAVELMHFEVLRDNGAHARAGESGRVVVTPYVNFAMPLVRYELGDVVELGQGGACPNGGLALERIVGRSKAMFTQADGQKFLPYVALGDVASIGPIARFRFVQTSLTTVEFRYRLSGTGTIDAERLAKVSRKYLGPSFTVTAAPLTDADEAAGRKHLVFESLV
jgi:phenylacetate-CoA ligase